MCCVGCGEGHDGQRAAGLRWEPDLRNQLRPLHHRGRNQRELDIRKKRDGPTFDLYSTTLQRHNTENSKHIFPGKELRGYSPNSHIRVSVSDSYTVHIPMIGLPILVQENRWNERGNT